MKMESFFKDTIFKMHFKSNVNKRIRSISFCFIIFIFYLISVPNMNAQNAPYPPSVVVNNAQWAPATEIIRYGFGSDAWPITWGNDDILYTTYSDGFGFTPGLPAKVSLGFGKVEGYPPKLSVTNIRSSDEQYGYSETGKKASGMLMVDGILYMWARNADNAGKASQLAWSNDKAKNWQWADWKFNEFGYCTFVNYGMDYSDARDGYVYVVSHNNPSAYNAANSMILMRVNKNSLKNRSAFEFYKGRDENGLPIWTSNVDERQPVFTHNGKCLRSGMSYNKILKRYFWWQQIPKSSNNPDTRYEGGFGVYDAPEPWGPWTTVYYTEKWDVGPGETGSFPTKWISGDGKTMYLVFSGDDSFSVRKFILNVEDYQVELPEKPIGLKISN